MTAGLLAAGLWAVYQPAQAFSLTPMAAVWGTLLFWVLVLSILRPGPWPSRRWLGLGAATGLAALLLSNLLLLAPLAIWRILTGNGNARRGIAILLFVAGLAAGTGPVWVFHRFVVREPVFLSAHAGLNFFIGNNPLATGYPRTPPGMRASQTGMLRDSIALAESETGRKLSHAEVSEFWNRKAGAFISQHRGAWLRLEALKVFHFWNGFSYDDLSVVSVLREAGILFRGPAWGAVVLAGLPGLLLAGFFVPTARPVVAAVFLHLASLLPVFITERYRLPVAPGLCLFAAWLAVRCVQQVRSGKWRFPALAVTTCLVVSPLILWPCRDPQLLALDPYNSGILALARNDMPLASQNLERAAALVPDNAEIAFALGNLRLATGDSFAARNHYRHALELNPRHDGAWNNLGTIAMQEERWDLAERFFAKSLAADPEDARTLVLHARMLGHLGRGEEAQAEEARAGRMDPRVLSPAFAEKLELPKVVP